jgi:sugar lactone lactonase YvrE
VSTPELSPSEPELAFDAQMELGESPVWDERTGTLYAVDILRGAIVRFDPRSGGAETVAVLGDLVGAIALRRDGGLVAATGTTIALLDERSNATIAAKLTKADGLRFNDGACDAQGRFWIGTMGRKEAPGGGTLYRHDGRGLTPMVASVSISNGIDWSADGTRMYYIDSATRRVDVFTFAAEDGTLSDRRIFAALDAGESQPDGLTVDADDHVWVALWDGSAVHRYRPDGVLDRVIEVPVSRPTSCAFGGDDLGDLYITSARTGLTPEQLEAQPYAGGVLLLRPGVRGRAPNRFAG